MATDKPNKANAATALQEKQNASLKKAQRAGLAGGRYIFNASGELEKVTENASTKQTSKE